MREQPRRDWKPAAKRQGVKPMVQDIALTEDMLRHFASCGSSADVLSGAVAEHEPRRR